MKMVTKSFNVYLPKWRQVCYFWWWRWLKSRVVEVTLGWIGYFTDDNFFVSWETSQFPVKALSSTLLCFRGPLDEGNLNAHLPGLLDDSVVSIRLFYVSTESIPRTLPHLNLRPFVSHLHFIAILTQIKENLPITTIPCRHISSRSSDEWDYAMCIIKE